MELSILNFLESLLTLDRKRSVACINKMHGRKYDMTVSDKSTLSFYFTSRETVSFWSQNTLYFQYLSLAVALNGMQYGVSFENFEELVLPYPLVGSAKKLVSGEISEI